MPKFTAETAAQMAKRSHEPGSKRFYEPPPPQPIPQPAPEPADFLASDLACACVETLTELRKASKPMHRAQLARALRDLRETWHLATGKPRPGLTRPDQQKPQRREIPRALNA